MQNVTNWYVLINGEWLDANITVYMGGSKPFYLYSVFYTYAFVDEMFLEFFYEYVWIVNLQKMVWVEREMKGSNYQKMLFGSILN